MKRRTRVISFLLVLALVLGLIPTPFNRTAEVLAIEVPSGPLSGNGGDNITWKLEVDTDALADWDLVQVQPYKLTLTGSGEMWDMEELSFSKGEYHSYGSVITSVSIDERITSLGAWAFYEFVSLKSITIPDSVTSIDEGAFCNCSELESVICGSGLTEIGELAFFHDISLSAIQFKEGLEKIDREAFSNCSSLQTVSLPESLTEIGDYGFYYTGLTNFTVPRNLSAMREGALIYNSELESIQVAEGNRYFCAIDNVLYRTQNDLPYQAIAYALKSPATQISIAGGTESIERYAFYSAKNITSITFPDTLKTIDVNACEGCIKLKELQIPDSVETIENGAFSDCSSLTSVAIGKSLQGLSSTVFEGCQAIGTITVAEDNPYLKAVDNLVYNKDCTCLYFYAPAKTDEEYHLPDTLERLGDKSINYVSALQKLYMPRSLVSIGDDAIVANKRLKDIFFAGNAPTLYSANSITRNAGNMLIYRVLSSDGWDANFWPRYTLAEWKPENSFQEEGTFEGVSWKYEGERGCISFTGPGEIPDFMEEEPAPWNDYMDDIQTIEAYRISGMGKYCFFHAEKLLRMETGKELKKIGDFAFADCGKLLFFDIAAAETIGTAAFRNDSSLKGHLVLEKAFSIGAGAFKGCIALTDATVGAVLASLEEEVFAGCTALNNFIVPESVTAIKARAFQNCVSLRTINIPAGVTAIGVQAFSGDAALEKVYFYGRVPESWEADSFENCSSGLTLYYRKAQTEWTGLGESWNELPLTGLDRFYTEKRDHYSFSNTGSSFGYDSNYRIPRQRYVDVLDSIVTGTYYFVINKSWGGSCYGMTGTTLEFYENSEFKVEDYDASAQNLYGTAAPRDKNAPLTKLIEAYQISQCKPLISGCGGCILRNMRDYRGLIRKVEEFERSGGLSVDSQAEPVVMAIFSACCGHAVVPVSVDQDSDGNFVMKIYDPNYPSSLQTLKINKNLSAISYGRYTYASYIPYSSVAGAMAGVQLYSNTGDDSLYLSIDKEEGEVTDAQGKGIEEIEGAYEQKPFNDAEEDVFSGIKSFVLPNGNYQLTAKEEQDESGGESTEGMGGTEDAENAEDGQESVTFYLASEENFAEIVSSDEDAVLEVREVDTENDELEIELLSDSGEKETASFTIMNELGMERTLEVEGGNATVKVAENDTITIEVPAGEKVSIDGKEAEVNDGQAVTSFVAAQGELPLRMEELETSVDCDANNKLSGTVNATVISNTLSPKKVTVTADYYEADSGKKAATYSKEVQLDAGMNMVSISFEDVETAFSKTAGQVSMICNLTVSDEEGNAAVSAVEGITVTLTKKTDLTDPTDPTDPTEPDDKDIAVTGVSVTPKRGTFGVGESFRLNASVIPKNASDKTLTFIASNDNVTVTPQGVVTAKKAGNSRITVRASNGQYAVTNVIVKNAPNKVSLNAQKKNLKVGKTFQIKVKLPENTVSNHISYSSSKKSVANVSSSGKVTAKKKGTAVITVKTHNGKQARLKVTVTKDIPVKQVTVNKKKLTMKVGDSVRLKASVLPKNATDKRLTYKASNNKVKVTAKGYIIAKKAGKSKITVKSLNGKKAVVNVTVKKAKSHFTFFI